jgi:hypothetical protein
MDTEKKINATWQAVKFAKENDVSLDGKVGTGKDNKITIADLKKNSKDKSDSIPRNNKVIIDELFKPDEDGISEWITREEIQKDGRLSFGNDGHARHGIFWRDDRYIWEKKTKNNKPTTKILALRTFGINKENVLSKNRSIRKDIQEYHKSYPKCVVCGCKEMACLDHKNDLYNDPRVLNPETQHINDFQNLCNHCNLQKREIAKKTRETGKRYGATNIPSLKIYNVDFIEGDETYDKNDKNAMVGTYWYDPIRFHYMINEMK